MAAGAEVCCVCPVRKPVPAVASFTVRDGAVFWFCERHYRSIRAVLRRRWGPGRYLTPHERYILAMAEDERGPYDE